MHDFRLPERDFAWLGGQGRQGSNLRPSVLETAAPRFTERLHRFVPLRFPLPSPLADSARATRAPTPTRRSPSQPDDQVADGGGLGEEWVVAGVEFHNAGCSTGELALQIGRGALVLRADEVRRGYVLPGR
jgi:hypothetical protein